jgi:hypothetical protein
MPFQFKQAGKLLLFFAFAVSALTSSAQTSSSSSSSQAAELEPAQAPPPAQIIAPDALPKTPVTDAERISIAISAYDLDLHLIPADSAEEVRANLMLHNTTDAPLTRIPLQISGSLRWQRFSAAGANGMQSLDFTQSPIATDADHTGFAQEAVVTLSTALAPGASLAVSALYAGPIKQSGERLEVFGTAPDRAALTDWDAIVPTSDSAATSLRGFGNVLWYPVAEPPAVLGDGNKFFDLIGRSRVANQTTSMRLRLTVEYAGEPPDGAIFDGQLQPLIHTADDDDNTIAESRGVATANWPAANIGFRIPSLFLTAQRSTPTPDQLLNVVTANSFAIAPYAEAAKNISPMLKAWLGPEPTSPLLLLDHKGEPYADHGFLAAQLALDAQPAAIAPSFVAPLTQAWLPSKHLWISEGFPQFMNLIWIERLQGRATALQQLDSNNPALSFAEPDFTADPKPEGQPLISATAETFYRLKAAFVWWQLREIAGETALQQAMIAYRKSATHNPAFEDDPKALEHSIEAATKTDLAWFFNDWVYRDRGLPDLAIATVNLRPLPAVKGKNAGYLVVVEVKNDGDAVAEVPVTVKSDVHASADRLRVPPHGTASTRILFEDTPVTVELNDGSVPELHETTHIYNVPPPDAKP